MEISRDLLSRWWCHRLWHLWHRWHHRDLRLELLSHRILGILSREMLRSPRHHVEYELMVRVRSFPLVKSHFLSEIRLNLVGGEVPRAPRLRSRIPVLVCLSVLAPLFKIQELVFETGLRIPLAPRMPRVVYPREAVCEGLFHLAGVLIHLVGFLEDLKPGLSNF